MRGGRHCGGGEVGVGVGGGVGGGGAPSSGDVRFQAGAARVGTQSCQCNHHMVIKVFKVFYRPGISVVLPPCSGTSKNCELDQPAWSNATLC